MLLLLQAAVAVALFADKSWQKYLPPDETGEVKRVRLLLSAPAAERGHDACAASANVAAFAAKTGHRAGARLHPS